MCVCALSCLPIVCYLLIASTSAAPRYVPSLTQQAASRIVACGTAQCVRGGRVLLPRIDRRGAVCIISKKQLARTTRIEKLDFDEGYQPYIIPPSEMSLRWQCLDDHDTDQTPFSSSTAQRDSNNVCTYICTCIHICVYIYIYIYTHICNVYVYIYIY